MGLDGAVGSLPSACKHKQANSVGNETGGFGLFSSIQKLLK
jgi:hypothetical protein